PKERVARKPQIRAKPVSRARQSSISDDARPSKPSRAAVTAQLTGLKRETPRIQPGIRLRDMIMLERKVLGSTTKFMAAITSSCLRAISARALENPAKAAARSDAARNTARTPVR